MCDPANNYCDGQCGGYCCGDNQQQNISEDSSFIDLILDGGNSGKYNNLVSSLTRSTGSAIVATFGPQVIKLAKKYPKLAALANLPVFFWFVSKYMIANMDGVWKWLMSYALASVAVNKEDQVFVNNVRSWILTNAVFKERRALVAQSALNAKHQGTKISDSRRVVYEGESTFQFFKHNGHLFIYTTNDYQEITI